MAVLFFAAVLFFPINTVIFATKSNEKHSLPRCSPMKKHLRTFASSAVLNVYKNLLTDFNTIIMRRLLSIVILLAAGVISVMAGAQADYAKYLKAYNSQMAARQYLPASRSMAKAAVACADATNYEGAFKLIAGFDKSLAERKITPDSMPAPYFYSAKARYDVYQRFSNHASAQVWLKRMANHAKKAGNDEIATEMLLSEAQYYYSTDNNEMADRCMARVIRKFDAAKDYKDADKAYRELIGRAVDADDARLVERTYESYMHWRDSIEAANADTELLKVKKAMADTVAEMKRMDHTITARTGTMVTFISLFIISLAALALGALFYWRVVVKSRRMKRRAMEADERNAAKSAMLQNMATSLKPTIDRLDQSNPAVQTLRGYVENVGILSELDSSAPKDPSAMENVNLEPFCNELAAEVRPLLKSGAKLVLDGTRGWARIDAGEVRNILAYLLDNAVKFTPEGGKVVLAYRKRGANSHQFIVSDSGPGIPEEEREDLFKAFNSSHDISDGDGLGLPICALRADKMGGSLTLDSTVTKGTSFILTIHTQSH